MTKKPKRPRPIIQPNTSSQPKRKFKSTSSLINTFHSLSKQLAHYQSHPTTSCPQKIQDIEQQLKDMGGLEVYQQASLKGAQRNGGYGSGKWLIETLKTLNIIKVNSKAT